MSIRQLTSISFLAVLIVLFQNCVPQFKVDDFSLTNLSSIGGDNFDPTGLGNDLLSLRNQGQILNDADDCRFNPEFDACIFYKNPVAQRGQAYPSLLLLNDSRADADQKFGIKFSGLSSPDRLISESFVVYYSGDNVGNVLQRPLSAGFKTNYSQDSQAVLAQASSYFYLNATVDEFKKRTGLFFAEKKEIIVDAYSTQDLSDNPVAGNAFFLADNDFPNGLLVLGYAQRNNGAPAQPMAISAEVVVHELAHANLYHAVGGAGSSSVPISSDENAIFLIDIYDTTSTTEPARFIRREFRALYRTTPIPDSTVAIGIPSVPAGRSYSILVLTSYCVSNMGCVDAINEGQADLHALMMFPDLPGLGDTTGNVFGGSINGSDDGSISRNPEMLLSRLRSQNLSGIERLNWVYQQTNSNIQDVGAIRGQIHGMGAAFTAIMWEMYRHDPRVDRRVFERTFLMSLQMMTNRMNYPGFRESMLTVDEVHFNARNRDVILDGFAKWGIN